MKNTLKKQRRQKIIEKKRRISQEEFLRRLPYFNILDKDKKKEIKIKVMKEVYWKKMMIKKKKYFL